LSKGIALSKKSKGIAKIVLSYFSESGKLEWGTLKKMPPKNQSQTLHETTNMTSIVKKLVSKGRRDYMFYYHVHTNKLSTYFGNATSDLMLGREGKCTCGFHQILTSAQSGKITDLGFPLRITKVLNLPHPGALDIYQTKPRHHNSNASKEVVSQISIN
jgi:hypothetical protein